MADPTDEEKAEAAHRKLLAEAFADGMEIFNNREAERKAKNNPEGGNGDSNGDGGNPPVRRSFGEWLLGQSSAK